MRPILILAKRELNSFFDSLIAYMLIIIFLGFSGLFTWITASFFGPDVFLSGQANLRPFFYVAYFTLFIFIPAITMRMIAEEKKTGTIELLLTKAVSDWQVVMGKFLACLALVAIAVFCTLPYYITISWLGPVDHGAMMAGYFGILLISCAYIGIGLFASSLTSNQIVAFLLALSLSACFMILFQFISMNLSGTLASFFDYLSFFNHYEATTKGVIDSKDVLYFLSITAFCLLATESVLAGRKVVE